MLFPLRRQKDKDREKEHEEIGQRLDDQEEEFVKLERRVQTLEAEVGIYVAPTLRGNT